MIELAEAAVLAEQLKKMIKGKRIKSVTVAHSPHKFAFFYEDPMVYPERMIGRKICEVDACGGYVVIDTGDMELLINDGVSLRYQEKNEKRPPKHQLFIEFEDLSSISASVQMYGGMYYFKKGENDNYYYKAAREKPSPLSDAFHHEYFSNLTEVPGMGKLSVKAFLATEQRIPGLGNGVLQDILYHSQIHPKRKMSTLSREETDRLYHSIKTILKEMIRMGGRNTEKDLFGQNGGYLTKLSKNTVGKPCPVCGTIIQKEAYLGGSIYYCGGCQINK